MEDTYDCWSNRPDWGHDTILGGLYTKYQASDGGTLESDFF